MELSIFPRSSTGRRILAPWLGSLVVGVSVGLSLLSPVQAFTESRVPVRAQAPVVTSGLPVVALSELPVQARKVHAQILGGGPFRYDKDGTVFFNRERLLPRQVRGFYREYTVPTPGVRHRGARRIVCGGKVVHLPETCFYTEDHYQSFREIDARR